MLYIFTHRVPIALITLAVACTATFGVQYTLTEIGHVTEGTDSYSHVLDINDLGQILGHDYTFRIAARSFLWQSGTEMDVNLPPSPDAIFLRAINNAGDGAGFSSGPQTNGPALWRNGQVTYLPAPGALSDYRRATDINDLGQAVGFAYIGEGNLVSHALLWRNGTVEYLGTLGSTIALAEQINNRTQVIGVSVTSAGDEHAFFWDNGVMTDLGTLWGTRTSARGINDAGQVVGYSTNDSGDHRAFLWQNGIMTDLGTLPGDISSQAWGINAQGQIVGVSWDPSYTARLFLYENAQMFDLSSQIINPGEWQFNNPMGINSEGWIIGSGYLRGHDRGFLLTPIPEPATGVILLCIAAAACPGRRQ